MYIYIDWFSPLSAVQREGTHLIFQNWFSGYDVNMYISYSRFSGYDVIMNISYSRISGYDVIMNMSYSRFSGYDAGKMLIIYPNSIFGAITFNVLNEFPFHIPSIMKQMICYFCEVLQYETNDLLFL